MTQPPELPPSNQPDGYGAPGPYGQPAYGNPYYPPQQPPPAYGYAPRPAVSGMYQAAAIINWVFLGLIIVGTCGLGIVAAAWFIPMTINIQNGAKDRQKHTALAVCTLLFCNVISGILMLVEDSKREVGPRF